MRIIFINQNSIWGGGEHWTLQTARTFRDAGHEVAMIVEEDSELQEKVKREDLPHHAVPKSRIRRWLKNDALLHWIRSDTDLLICNSGRDLRVGAAIKKKRPRIKLIFRRGLDKAVSNDLFHRRVFREMDLLLCNSEATRQTMARSLPWFSKTQMHVVHNPLDIDEFLSAEEDDVRSNLGIPEGAPVIGIIGRLARQKGHRTLFSAFVRIQNRFPSAKLLVVGGGELEDELKCQTEDMGISRHVIFVGPVERVQPYYRACDVIAIPSLFEGFCFVGLEAQLLGKPVVASNVSSLPEIVQDGRTGFLVSVGDSEDLTMKLIDLLNSEGLRRTLGQAGKKWVTEKFDAKHIYEDLEQTFNTLIKSA